MKFRNGRGWGRSYITGWKVGGLATGRVYTEILLLSLKRLLLCKVYSISGTVQLHLVQRKYSTRCLLGNLKNFYFHSWPQTKSGKGGGRLPKQRQIVPKPKVFPLNLDLPYLPKASHISAITKLIRTWVGDMFPPQSTSPDI